MKTLRNRIKRVEQEAGPRNDDTQPDYIEITDPDGNVGAVIDCRDRFKRKNNQNDTEQKQ